MESSVQKHRNSEFQKLTPRYRDRRVAVTGGASFIGSHLVDALCSMGADVTVLDDLSSGKLDYVNPAARFARTDLMNLGDAQRSLSSAEIVFHLAAVHGGRGFIESQEAAMTANLAIDQIVFRSAERASMVVHASSACAYPINLQAGEGSRGFLAETDAGLSASHLAFPDGVYGWTKLMGEMQLEQLAGSAHGPSRGRSARIFTAYGERENESHAAVALIAKSLLHMDPFEIWGTGEQTRNFTYVADTVAGLLELGVDGSDEVFRAYNIGTSIHSTVNEFIEVVWATLGWRPKSIHRDVSKPTGVGNRAANNAIFEESFGWTPDTSLENGISETVNWYRGLASRPTSLPELEKKLMSR